MATSLFFVYSVAFAVVSASFFDIQYPSVYITAEKGGNLSIQAGPNGGNIYMIPHGNVTVYIGHTDMMKLLEISNSLPPTWKTHTGHGHLGAFFGGSSINILLEAIDPEGGKLTFEKVSGAFPPGVHLSKSTGRLTGIIPDVDATYEFGIRVTDSHGKYADHMFSIDARENDECQSNPCHHNGVCTNEIDHYKCDCIVPYGGPSCQYNCSTRAIGIDYNVQRIPDAQLSSYYESGDHPASDGRLHSPRGWVGKNTRSWLQVDIGRPMSIHAVATQGQSSSFYIKTYRVEYSEDGNTFKYVTNGTSPTDFSGSDHVDSVIQHSFLKPVIARYIRFRPQTFHANPGMRVEIYGCEVAN